MSKEAKVPFSICFAASQGILYPQALGVALPAPFLGKFMQSVYLSLLLLPCQYYIRFYVLFGVI